MSSDPKSSVNDAVSITPDEKRYAPHSKIDSNTNEDQQKSTPKTEASTNQPEKTTSDSSPQQTGSKIKEKENDEKSKSIDDAGAELEEKVEKKANPLKKAKAPLKVNAIWLDICIILLLLAGGFMGWKYYQQNKALPPTLLERTRLDYENILEQYQKTQLDLINAEKRRIHIDNLFKQSDRLIDMRKALELKKETITQKEKEIDSKRAEMHAYFLRFRVAARQHGKGLEFESLILPKAQRTYLEVIVQRIHTQGVSIVHAGGATIIPHSELPDNLQTRWGYTDPLGLADMNKEAVADQKLKDNLGKSLPKFKMIEGDDFETYPPATPATPATPSRQALSPKSYEPPSKSPSVTTGATPKEKKEPSNLDDKWTPPTPPLPLEN